jgi:hypothetical protein
MRYSTVSPVMAIACCLLPSYPFPSIFSLPVHFSLISTVSSPCIFLISPKYQPANKIPSRRWPPGHQIHSGWWRSKGHLQRRHAPPDPVVRDADHVRCSGEATQRGVPDRHEGLADGKHHVPCVVEATSRRIAPDLPNAGPRLRRARSAEHRQRSTQERRRTVQCLAADHAA